MSCLRKSRSRRRRAGLATGLLAAAVTIWAGGCGAAKFRYDRLHSLNSDVEFRDLEDLIADGAAGTPLSHGDVAVDRVEYDFAAERDEYRLGENDVLNVYVLGHPEMSSQRIDLGEVAGSTIRKDGFVYLPVIGRTKATGLTVTEFEINLRNAAARFVVDPEVNVEILEYESQKFYVLGEVRAPGAFAVDGDTTLIEAVAMAGGTPETANLETASVVRRGRLLPINLADMVQRGDISRNVFMRSGDVVYVPDNRNEKVFVLGEVLAPGVVPIDNGRITLAEALASAGGPTPAQARRELAVIRGGFAKPVVYRFDLEKAMLVDELVTLRPGDRVVVAPTGLATASRYMQQILPFLQGAQAAGIAASGTSNVLNQAAATAN